MLCRVIALLLLAATHSAAPADAAETMFATLSIERLNWKSDEIIYEGRLTVRGALIASARSILGGEIVCDVTGCDHWFHFPAVIRGVMPDRSSQSSKFEDWLELVRVELANSRGLIEITGELTFVVPRGAWEPKRTVWLTTSDFELGPGKASVTRCQREGCVEGTLQLLPPLGRK